MSRLLLLCAAISWFAWLVVSPIAWTGCNFRVGPIDFAPDLKVTVNVAGDMDLTKVETVVARITGASNEERTVPKPVNGWPSGAEFHYAPGNDGKIVVTITAYDASHKLLGLGRGESENYSDVEITIHSQIAWN